MATKKDKPKADEAEQKLTGATPVDPTTADAPSSQDAASAAAVAPEDKVSGPTTPETNPLGVRGADTRTEIDSDKPSPPTGVVKAVGADQPVPEAPDEAKKAKGAQVETWRAHMHDNVDAIIAKAEHEGGDAMHEIRKLAFKLKAAL